MSWNRHPPRVTEIHHHPPYFRLSSSLHLSSPTLPLLCPLTPVWQGVESSATFTAPVPGDICCLFSSALCRRLPALRA